MSGSRHPAGLALALLLAVRPAAAQVSLSPPSIEPAAWERIAVRVVNQAGPALVRVRVDLPDALGVLGVDHPPGWTAAVAEPTDTTPRAIVWSGGAVDVGAYREFVFLGRLASDVRRRDLVVPVRLTKADGTVVAWARGGDGPPPVLRIQGTTTVSPWAAFALAGAALGVAALAVILAVRRAP